MKSSVGIHAAQRALLGIGCAGTVALIVVGRGSPPIPFIALVVATFAAYGFLVRSLTRVPALRGRTLVAACVCVMVVAVVVPARSSRDVYAYVMYGRIVAQHHASPYSHVPADYPDDPALQRVQAQFRDTSSVYGPIFTGISATGMSVCGSSPVCGRMFFQLLEALAVLCAAWLVLRATGSWAAATCVGLNPVLLVAVVNGAHNDGLVMAGLLGAVLIARERPAVAGLLLGAAALVKVNVLLAGAVLIAWLLVRVGKRTAAILASTTIGTVVVGYLLAGGTVALRPLHQTAQLLSSHSLWFPAERWIAAAFDVDDWSRARAAGYAAHVPLFALAVVVVTAVVVASGRIRDHGPEPVVAAALAVYILASPYVLPWYAATVIPLLATRWRSRTTWLVLSYSALLYLAYPSRYPLHRSFTTLILPETMRDVLPIVEVVLLVVLAFAAWRPRRQRAAPAARPELLSASAP